MDLNLNIEDQIKTLFEDIEKKIVVKRNRQLKFLIFKYVFRYLRNYSVMLYSNTYF